MTAKLEIVSLWDKRQYEAMSWAWGLPGPMKTIHLQNSTYEVTINLDSCLLYLRGDTHPRVYWVDALCIDQRNGPDSLEELDSQVSLMHRIIGEAVRARVWAGALKQESTLMLILQA